MSLKVNSYTAWGAGNVGDEVSIAVGFSLSSDWSKGWLSSYLVQSQGAVMLGRKDITIISIFCHRYFLKSSGC